MKEARECPTGFGSVGRGPDWGFVFGDALPSGSGQVPRAPTKGWVRDKFWAGFFGRWDAEDAEDADGWRRGGEFGGGDFGGEPAGDFLVFA